MSREFITKWRGNVNIRRFRVKKRRFEDLYGFYKSDGKPLGVAPRFPCYWQGLIHFFCRLFAHSAKVSAPRCLTAWKERSALASLQIMTPLSTPDCLPYFYIPIFLCSAHRNYEFQHDLYGYSVLLTLQLFKCLRNKVFHQNTFPRRFFFNRNNNACCVKASTKNISNHSCLVFFLSIIQDITPFTNIQQNARAGQ